MRSAEDRNQSPTKMPVHSPTVVVSLAQLLLACNQDEGGAIEQSLSPREARRV